MTAEFKRATDSSAPLDAVIIMLGTNDAKKTNWVNLGNESQYAADATRMVCSMYAFIGIGRDRHRSVIT